MMMVMVPLQAWLRARGSNSVSVFTADTVADTFGVVKSSYQAVPLAARSVLTAVCKGAGKPKVGPVLQFRCTIAVTAGH
jgi:hypothetical protein